MLLPVLALVDTAGAYPGIGADERGQAEAIARSTDRCLSLTVPLVAVVIGEGGSGGAVAIATANRVLMLEHSIYTVASPEAAASILWRDPARAIDAALADDRPSLIACKTIIGKGAPNKQGTHNVHGAALGADEVAATRLALGWTAPAFEIPADIAAARGRVARWSRQVGAYSTAVWSGRTPSRRRVAVRTSSASAARSASSRG